MRRGALARASGVSRDRPQQRSIAGGDGPQLVGHHAQPCSGNNEAVERSTALIATMRPGIVTRGAMILHAHSEPKGHDAPPPDNGQGIGNVLALL